MLKHFPHFLQLDAMDCGPTCLRMIAKYYGRNYTLPAILANATPIVILGKLNAKPSILS